MGCVFVKGGSGKSVSFLSINSFYPLFIQKSLIKIQSSAILALQINQNGE